MTYRIRPTTSEEETDGILDRSDQERSEDTVEFENLESRTLDREENISLEETDEPQDLESTSKDRQELCFSIIRRCCFLLTCVRGPKDLQVEKEYEEEEEEDENKIEHFYRSLEESKSVSRALKKRCELLMKFVCGVSCNQINLVPQLETLDCDVLYKAMKAQQIRAESRIFALNQILELILQQNKSETDEKCSDTKQGMPKLLSSVYQQLLIGCFGLHNLAALPENKASDPEYEKIKPRSQLYHYLENIQAASENLQNNIRKNVHEIFNILVDSLDCERKEYSSGCEEQQKLLTIFALSLHYQLEDIKLAVNNGLLSKLIQLTSSEGLNTCLGIASMRLVQILAICCGYYAHELDKSMIESILNFLHSQLEQMLNYHMGKFTKFFLNLRRHVKKYSKLRT